MNMNYTLNIIIAFVMITVIIKILMNVINHFGIDFVGFFEDVMEENKKNQINIILMYARNVLTRCE